jgi:indoleamine 2,3-dioxygenase
MKNWTLRDRGFLPTPDPLTHTGFAAVEGLARDLPAAVADGTFRDRARQIGADFWRAENLDDYLDSGNERGAERLMMLFSYFASAYVHGAATPLNELPPQLARPLVRLARHVGRPPILSYASYCLYNWKRTDPQGPIALGNIELLQNFSAESKQDEDWFILVHVDIEARASDALHAVESSHTAVARQDDAGVEAVLETLLGSLNAMNATLARMPERCRPEVYFRKVRPYIFGFDGVVYRGCFDDEPQTLRGETGAQSSIIPSLIRGLGLVHRSSMLTQHLEDMKNYMPPAHRAFVERQNGRQPNLRDFVLHACFRGDRAGGGRLRELYNECLRQVIAFRSKHFEYAVNYIQRRVDNPTGTGGTPFIRWLKQLIEESEGHLLTFGEVGQ